MLIGCLILDQIKDNIRDKVGKLFDPYRSPTLQTYEIGKDRESS